MSHWWRAHDESRNSPKLQRLPLPLFRTWYNLMCLASANDGILPSIGDVAFELRLNEQRTAAAIAVLVSAKLFDQREDGRFEPHNWAKRQFKSDVTDPTNATRQKRFRERHAVTDNTVTPTGTVTLTREQSTETDSEREEPSLRSVVVRAETRTDFDEFWRVYPHKVGKQAAFKAFVKSMKSGGVTLPRIMFALAAYVNKTDDRPWCNPATWLNEGRWDDQPAQEKPRNGNGKSLLATLDKLHDHLSGNDDNRAREADLLGLPPR